MRKERGFPDAVMYALKDLGANNDPRLPTMRRLVQKQKNFKNMWHRILAAERTDLYVGLQEKEVVEMFLDAVIDCSREEVPVFYMAEKQKKAQIEKILGYEKKMKQVYEELFGKEAVPLVSSLQGNVSKAVKKVEESYSRASGGKKKRVVTNFAQELAQRNLWVYGQQLDSVIRTAVLAIYDYTFNSDVNIRNITKWKFPKTS